MTLASTALHAAAISSTAASLEGCAGSPVEPTEKLPIASRMLVWSADEKIIANRHMQSLFAAEEFANDPRNIHPLPKGSPLTTVSYRLGNQPHTLDDYIRRQNVTGLLVVKDGKIVIERYASGNDERTKWTAWSVGKSVVSTLTGIALKQGHIRSLDEPMTRYVPELAGSAYEGVTIRNMLQMSSGVKWSENPSDPAPNVADFARCLSDGKPGCVIEIAKRLPRVIDAKTGLPAKPGTVWNYSNIDAFVTGVMLQRATGRSLAKYMEEQIWKPYGMEQPGFWMAESKGGLNSGAGDFSASLRDYGRFGQFILNDGVLPDGTKQLPDGWMAQATTWTPQSAGKYGFLWWYRPVAPDSGLVPETTPTSASNFAAVGLFGQYIFINPKENLVMVQWSTYPTPATASLSIETAALFNAISDALH